MGKAAYGALMGLGQGISQWGGMLATEAVNKEREKREFDRQQSLMDIRQRYEKQLEMDRYNPNSELGGLIEQQRVNRAGEEFDPNNPIFQGKEELRLQRLAEANDPNNPVFQMTEARRKQLADEEQARAGELRKINPYAGNSSGGDILSTINPANYTEESFAPFIAQVSQLMDADPTLSQRDAALIAMQDHPLVPRKTSTPAGETAVQKSMLEEYNAFKAANTSAETMRDALINDYDIPEAAVAGKSRDDLLGVYRQLLEQDYAPFGTGLMNNPPPAGRNTTAPATPAMGEPGSSKDNPIDATQFSSKPPSGTWVRLPDGTVRQVP